MIKEGFDYVVSDQTKILILGTAPGMKSSEEKRYYQNANNKIWEAISSVVGITINRNNYDSILIETPIGLWDVFNKSEGESSKDSERNFHGVNEFEQVLDNYQIKYIIFNGNGRGKNGNQALREFLGKYEELLDRKGIKIFVLTSTSGNNRLKPKEKLRLWQNLLSLLIQK